MCEHVNEQLKKKPSRYQLFCMNLIEILKITSSFRALLLVSEYSSLLATYVQKILNNLTTILIVFNSLLNFSGGIIGFSDQQR